MNDGSDLQNERPWKAIPRELAVAAIALIAIMIAMGLALWLVAGQTRDQHGQTQSNTSGEVPTEELLQLLSGELGSSATPADLEAAVQRWIEQQGPSVVLASAAGH